MKKKLTLKDCTKENFERSWELLEDAQRAYREKDLELGKRWRDSGYSDAVYDENKKIRKEYSDAITNARKNLVPYVGLSCSIRAYTDYYACVITKVITPNKVEVSLKYGTMSTEVFSRRKNGGWYTYGVNLEDYPCRLIFNSAHHYIDPCF